MWRVLPWNTFGIIVGTRPGLFPHSGRGCSRCPSRCQSSAAIETRPEDKKS
jgi:hypothetical protein